MLLAKQRWSVLQNTVLQELRGDPHEVGYGSVAKLIRGRQKANRDEDRRCPVMEIAFVQVSHDALVVITIRITMKVAMQLRRSRHGHGHHQVCAHTKRHC